MIDRWGINLCGDLLLPSSLNLDERNLLNIMLWTGEYSNQNVERNFFSISKNSRLKNFRLILRSSFIWREEIKILLGRSILAIFSVPLSYIFFFNIIFRLMYFFFLLFFCSLKYPGFLWTLLASLRFVNILWDSLDQVGFFRMFPVV